MPKPIVSAASGALPAEGRLTRRLFLSAGSATTLFATLGVGVASEAVAAAAPAVFNAAGYVALWRRYGNIVTVAGGLGGIPAVSIYFPDGSRKPPFAELARWNVAADSDPAWQDAVIDFLNAEGASI